MEVLTREIWVSNEGVLNAGLDAGFGRHQMRLVEVPFMRALNTDDLAHLSQIIGKRDRADRRIVTFVSEGLEQLGDDLNHSLREVNENRVLHFSELLLKAVSLCRTTHNLDISLIFRRHPKETSGNQVGLPNGFDYESRLETSDSVLEVSTHVFGLSSRLLYEASERGIQTASGFRGEEFEKHFVGSARSKISSLGDIASISEWITRCDKAESIFEVGLVQPVQQTQKLKQILLDIKEVRP